MVSFRCMKMHYLVLSVLLIAVSVGCSRTRASSPAIEEAAVRAADTKWLEAVKAHDYERAFSFWADDAVVLPPNSAAVVGKDAIRRYVTEASSLPNFSIT